MPNSEKLKAKIREAGISQAEFGRRCGIDSTRVSLMCNKDQNVNESTLAKMCDVLGCKAEDIWNG